MAAVNRAIAASRSSGTCNLAGRGLQQVPSAVYDLEEPLPGGGDGKWWEVAELQKLDLSRNVLQPGLPHQLSTLTTLTQLDCSHNALQELFPGLAALQCLRSLDVSHNQLRHLPDDAAALACLASLACGDNQLRALPEWLGYRQAKLAVLSAPRNHLTGLPPGLAHASSLTRLDMDGNRLESLGGPLLANLPSLQELLLPRNALCGTLGREVGALRVLRVLDVRENRLTALPAELAGCTSLVELHAGFNQLSQLPSEMGSLPALRTLDLRNNRLVSLPPELGQLKLSLLDLTNNELRSLPPELGLMTTLRSLPLDGNPIKTIRREVVAGPISGLLKALVSKLPDAAPLHPGQAARSGNVFGADEAGLAAEVARKLAVSAAAAAATAAAEAEAPGRQPLNLFGGPSSRGDWAGAGGGSGGGGGGSAPSAAAGAQRSSAPARNAGARGTAGIGGRAEWDQQGLGGPPAGGTPAPLAGGAPGRGMGGQELSLRGAGLREVPLEVWQAGPGLGKLDLSDNPITYIPPEALAGCVTLRQLLLQSTRLSAWPLPLPPMCPYGQLGQLRELSLRGCSGLGYGCIRSAVPFAACPGLTRLDLSGVPAAGGLPPGSLACLQGLESLDLSQTGCAALPPDVLCLPTLRVLILANNRLAVLPDAISTMTRLEELNLANNDLGALPPTLGLLSPVLRSLSLEGNPLRTIRRPILERGSAAVLQYLKDKIPA